MPYRVHDMLTHWRAQGAITEAQLAAGQRFLRLHDKTAIGEHASIDPDRIRVDVSRRPEAAAERMAMTRGELDIIKREVGSFDFNLLCRVLGRGEDLAASTPAEADRRYLSRRVRDALAFMANLDRLGVDNTWR